MQTDRSRSVGELVEQQLLRWRLEQREPGPESPNTQISPAIVAMSHAVGAGGAEVAARVGAALGIPVHDRDVVEYVIKEGHVRREAVDLLEWHAQSRFEEFLTEVATQTSFDRHDYLRLVVEAIGAFWQHGPCVISGHGSIHLVPRAHALTVRIRADESVRLHALAAREQLDLREARHHLRHVDRERAGYHRRCFNTVGISLDHYSEDAHPPRGASDARELSQSAL